MKPRSIIVYLVLFIMVGAFYYVYDVKMAARENQLKEAKAKIFDLKREQVTGLTLIADGQEMKITREGPDGWMIVSPVKTPGDRWVIDDMVRSALAGKKDRVFEDPVKDVSEFGLDKPAVSLTLLQGDKSLAPALGIGRENPMGQLYYARLGDSDQVFTVGSALKSGLDKSLYDLRNKSLVLAPGEEIDGIIISGDAGVTELERKGIRTWDLVKPEKTAADDDKVQSILYQALKSRVAQFVNPEDAGDKDFGFDHPAVTVQVRAGDTSPVELTIGKAEPGPPAGPGEKASITGYWVKSSERPEIILADARAIDTLKTSPADLVDRRIVVLDQGRLDKIEIKGQDKTFLVKKIEDVWDVLEPAAPVSRNDDIEKFIRQLDGLTYDKKIEPSPEAVQQYGLDKPDLTITFSGPEEIRILAVVLEPVNETRLAVRSWTGQGEGVDKGPVYLVERNPLLNSLPAEIRPAEDNVE